MLLTSLVTTVVTSMLAGQVPLSATCHHWQAEDRAAILADGEIVDWSLDKLPDPNATDHLVFETVHSLLQRWPNTRMRNGHNIVPGSIPIGTLLYHGTNREELPPGPEWVATDPEHSYFFCRDTMFNHFQQGCWHFTLAATRPPKVVYFDGNSAASLAYGSLDTQDLLAWGSPRDGDMYDEKQRVKILCNWGKTFDIDGFVRMEMDFEVVFCDFTSGVRVVSFVNLASQAAIRQIRPFVRFEAMNAGSWHNRFPGETRIQLNLAGLVSFYDTRLAPSLVDARAGQERWDHRAGNVSSTDLLAVKSRLEAALNRPESLSSGIDWKTLIQVTVDRYAQRLALTRHLLDLLATEPEETFGLADRVQTCLRIMLTPYLHFSAAPTDRSDKASLDWAVPIYKLCATTHTCSMDSMVDSMTDGENLLLQAVRGTSREICRVVTKMWAAGVHAGIDPLLRAKEYPDIPTIIQLWDTWTQDLNRLMGWLDWSVWVKCVPDSGPEEMCYLPTWPVGFPPMKWGRKPPPLNDDQPSERPTSFECRRMVVGSLAKEMKNTVNPDPDEWVRPQPKCVRRVETLASTWDHDLK